MENLGKKIVSFVLRLSILCVIASAALAWVYLQTKPRIEAEKLRRLTLARKEILPLATEFVEKPLDQKENYALGLNEEKKTVGKILKKTKRGYGGPIEVLIALDSENKVSGVKILSQFETPGLGTKIKEKNFLVQFLGRTIDELKLKKDKGKIEGVTGATISSRAVLDAVREGAELGSKLE